MLYPNRGPAITRLVARLQHTSDLLRGLERVIVKLPDDDPNLAGLQKLIDRHRGQLQRALREVKPA